MRVCRFCKRTLVALPVRTEQAEEHCGSRNCHWCMTCDRKKRAEAKH